MENNITQKNLPPSVLCPADSMPATNLQNTNIDVNINKRLTIIVVKPPLTKPLYYGQLQVTAHFCLTDSLPLLALLFLLLYFTTPSYFRPNLQQVQQPIMTLMQKYYRHKSAKFHVNIMISGLNTYCSLII